MENAKKKKTDAEPSIASDKQLQNQFHNKAQDTALLKLHIQTERIPEAS